MTTVHSVEATPTSLPPTLHEFLRRAGAPLGPEHLHLSHTPLPREPYPTQQSGVSEFLKQDDGRFGLWDDPGTGKTLVAIALMALFAPWENRFILLMPPILLEQLEKTLQTWGADFIAQHRVHFVRQNPANRLKLYKEWDTHGWPTAIAMSYEMFTDLTSPRLQPMDRKTGIRPKPLPPELGIDQLDKLGFSFIIPDEAHALGNAGTKIHERVFEFVWGRDMSRAATPNGALLMTGTPLRGKVEDGYGLIRILLPKLYGSYANFVRAHCIQIQTKFGAQTIAYDNLDYLHRQLYKKGRRVEARDVLKHLKEPLAIEWPVTMNKEHKALYDKMVKEQMLILGDQIIDLTSEQRLRQALMRVVTCPHLYSEGGKTPRSVIYDVVDQYIDTIDATNQDKNKGIIFCWFQETCEALANYLTEWKDKNGKVWHLKPLVINGATPAAARKKILEAYHNDPKNRMLILNFISGGAGLDLQDHGSDMLCLEPTGLPHHYRQAMARVARGEQTEQCIMRIVVVKGTVYPGLYRNFIKREEDIQEVAKDKHQLFKFFTGE